MWKRSRPSPALRVAVRAAAAGAIAAAVAVPLLRRRLRTRQTVTVVVTAAGPLALAVLHPRSHRRDIGLFALQMWAFTMVHELPYDDPEGLRRRLRVGYPIVADRVIGAGRLPNTRLQRTLARPGRVGWLERFLAVVHWAWFVWPHATLLWILLRREEHFARSARQMAVAFDLGCVIYFAAPTAPPWWAAEHGYTDGDEVRRLMVEVGERFWGRSWPMLYDSLGGNPWAAMPSLHFATAVLAAMLLSETGPVAGTVGWAYAAALGLALVHLGEHYVTDLLVGAALIAVVRRGEPIAEPLVDRVNAALRRLERIANS